MANQPQSEPSLGLDRRQLLAAMVAVTAVGIAAEAPHIANAAEVVSAAELPVSDIPALNVCAAGIQ